MLFHITDIIFIFVPIFSDCRTKMLKFYVSKNLRFFFPFRVQELKPADQDEFLNPRPILEPWQSHSDSNLDRASLDSIPLGSREPDGASSEEYPAASEEDHDDVEKKDGDVLSSSEDTKNAKGNKKKRQRSLFACLSPARLSFRKKSERVNESQTDTAKLMKEI